jgi:hypothetical protein
MNNYKVGDRVWYVSDGVEYYRDRFKVKSGIVRCIGKVGVDIVVDNTRGSILYQPFDNVFTDKKSALKEAKSQLMSMVYNLNEQICNCKPTIPIQSGIVSTEVSGI